MNNPISISSCFDYSIPIDSQLRLISNCGFKYISLGSNANHTKLFDKSERKHLKYMLEKYAIKIDTIHGCSLDEPNALEMLELTVESANYLGAKIVVVHTTKEFSIIEEEIQDKADIALKTCSSLIKIADKYKTNFALENLHPDAATDVLRRVLPLLDKEYFGFCYDSSHDQVDGPRPFTLLKEFKDRLFTVHLSDRLREFEDHVIPGEGFVDFNIISNELKSSRYDKPLLFEVMTLHSQYKDVEKFLSKVYEAGLIFLGKVQEAEQLAIT